MLLSKSLLIQLYGLTTSPILVKNGFRKSASYSVYLLEEQKRGKEVLFFSKEERDKKKRKITVMRKCSKAFDVLAMST